VARFKKWLVRGTAGILTLLVVVIAGLYLLAERTLRRGYADVPSQQFTAPTDSASVAAGERLAVLRGCLGCHGSALEGGVFFDEPFVGRIVVPDLTRVALEYTDSELERAIRGGVRKNGRGMLVMPSDMFYNLSDADLGAIIAFVRSVDPGAGPETEISLGPLARGMLVAGVFSPAVAAIDHGAPRLDPGDGTDPVQLGRYLATTVCTECHGTDFSGSSDGSTPSLSQVLAYSIDDFTTLMREGRAVGDRELDLMAQVALGRFTHFTDAEIRAVHAFLRQEFGTSSEE